MPLDLESKKRYIVCGNNIHFTKITLKIKIQVDVDLQI